MGGIMKTIGAKAVKAIFFFKLQLFIFKMDIETNMSSHINELKLLIKQLTKVDAKVEEKDIKVILLNSLHSTYNNDFFTLSQLSSQSLDDIISSLLDEDKILNERLNERIKERYLEFSLHLESALLTKKRMSIKI